LLRNFFEIFKFIATKNLDDDVKGELLLDAIYF